MPRNQYYKPGDWNAICDRCGFKFKASELKRDWQGFMVCPEDFETRHPLDFLRAKREKIRVPWTRIDPPTTTTGVTAPTDESVGNNPIGNTKVGGS
jgi:hypothetical protein